MLRGSLGTRKRPILYQRCDMASGQDVVYERQLLAPVTRLSSALTGIYPPAIRAAHAGSLGKDYHALPASLGGLDCSRLEQKAACEHAAEGLRASFSGLSSTNRVSQWHSAVCPGGTYSTKERTSCAKRRTSPHTRHPVLGSPR